ncbi:hypothetical protein BJX65DRAFT_294668 [Aspergillus insuetus]
MKSLQNENGFDDKMRSVTPTNIEASDRLLDEEDRCGLWWAIGLVLIMTVLSGLAGMFVGYKSRDLDEMWSRHVSHYFPIRDIYSGGYPANVEGLHHLHCLNLLRQSLYYSYEYYHARGKEAFKNDDFIVRKHVPHSLDILRQQLICTIDTGHPSPFVDFNTEHRCRNFEDIRVRAESNQLPKKTPRDFLRPPGAEDRVFHRVSDEYTEVYGQPRDIAA